MTPMADNRKFPFSKYLIILSFVLLLVVITAGSFLILRNLLPNYSRKTIGVPVGKTTPVPIPIETGDTGVSSSLVEPSSAQVGSQTVLINLSEGRAQPQAFVPLPLVNGDSLTEEEVNQILSRLPDLPVEEGDQTDFNLAQEPIPPPRTGETITSTFPPAATEVSPVDTGETGALQVVRYSPEGEISIAPFINVTFNQPMVPLGTLADLAAEQVPVQVEPALQGTWRWLGTKTLTFEYDSDLIDRLPKATEYRITVPAGTQSAVGGVLGETVSWTFTTPPPKIVTSFPYDESQPLEPVIFISFDQRIVPAAVLETIRVIAGDQKVSLELASDADIQANERVNQLVKYAQEGRWLAFKAQAPLPADTAISVTIGPGTPSGEGPLVTQDAQSFTFRTYAPLGIVSYGCSWEQNNKCRPLTPFNIQFNNPLDTQAYTEDMLMIKPAILGVVVNVYGNSVQIKGATSGQTNYTVYVDGDIQDIYGQKLGEDRELVFKVGPAESILVGPDQAFITLDPAIGQATDTKPVYSVYVINYNQLEVKIYAVRPSDWPAYKQYLREWQRTDQPPTMPGNLVSEKTIPVEAPADTLTQVDIDLSEYMDGDFGHFIVVVTPPQELMKNEQERYWSTVQTWVQITQIGLDAFVDHSEMVVWATSLKDGAPLANVTVKAGAGDFETVTGEDGTVRFNIPHGSSYLTVQKGSDTALLPRSINSWDDETWYSYAVNDELRWYVFDDRQMYRPGEEIHVKGWMRRIGGKQDGDVGLIGDIVTSVAYQFTDPQGNALGSGQAPVNALGGFDLAFTIPQAVNLGYAQLIFQAVGDLFGIDGGSYNHSFQIQEFRTPEFEVSARNESTGPYYAGGQGVVAVEAKYYAGDPLPGADVTWHVTQSPSSYSPPNWPDFTFGTWQPWWWSYGYNSGRGYYAEETYYKEMGGEATYASFTGKTDASGTHYLNLDFDQSGVIKPVSVVAEATVMDVNRQAWSSSTTLLVHPASLYIGLRSDRYFVQKGTPIKVDFIVTDIDGNPVADRPVEVKAARLEWKTHNGNWAEEEVDVQTCKLGSTLEPVTCTFETPIGGTYQITAVVMDDLGRQNQSQFTRWVSGGQRPAARDVEQETVTLIPDKETYQPGDVAQILVQSPFSPAEGMLTVSRNGILYTERFRLEDGTATLSVPIEDRHIPNLNLQVDLSGAAQRLSDQGEPLLDIPSRPAYATGQLVLKIPPLQRTLAVQAVPDVKELEPGGETTLSVKVTDANGQPVPDTELAVVVVDEAILALTNYQLTDPMSIFYTDRPSYLSSVYGRASIVLVDPLALASKNAQNLNMRQVAVTVEVEKMVEMGAMAAEAPAAMPMATQAAGEAYDTANAPPQPIRVREDFNPLAAFSPSVYTDANGSARIPVKIPDNLTRYRIMVVAVDSQGRQFGTGESSLVGRLPLMVRPSAPRFLNFGDSFELPVVLQNQTGESMVVDVVVRTSNLELTGANGKRVTVPAHDRVEVRFPAATNMAGTARIQIAAVSGAYADAANVELPVYTPATTEAFATYGVVDEGAVVQPVLSPSGVFPQYGGLEVSTSSTALQALTDAVLYLVAYPFECSEQLSSRILAVAALRDVLTAFQAEGLPSVQEMESAVQRDIDRLKGMQNEDGGFPYWRRGFESIPFNTIHVAHALYRAQSKGYEIPTDMQQRAMDYLKDIENHYPYWYSQQTRWTLSSYALYVRNLTGDRDSAKALRILNEAGLDNLRMEAIGWLWPVLQGDPNAADELDAIRTFVNNRVVETPGAANFTTYYDDQTYLLLSSDRRTDAILLDALMTDDPQSDLIPKVVNGLLAHRTKGRWGNTQENVFILLSLDRYFNTYEAQTPDFVAQIWLGDTYAGSSEFHGRTTERHETVIPMSYLVSDTLAAGGTQNLILSKEGAGRLYYRLGLSYAPVDLSLPPVDMGFVVQRRYEAVDDPDDVYQDSDGVWHIKAGARVRVRITMVADNRRYHVALVDPLPAGLEIVNPALAVSGSIPQDPGSPNYGGRYGWWWRWSWYEHQNLRDERAEAFTSLLWEGVYEYTYIARATTPGTFMVPPAKAEEMYSPEVFGRSSGDRVVVEDR
jgi:uncharacterized protein YfaS (alpha-2-macroglobulin family)